MQTIRRSVLAGEWYPAETRALAGMVRGFLDSAAAPESRAGLRGLIVPHAGYAFSGRTAAFGYRALEGHRPDTVVVLSPFHAHPPGRYLVNAAEAYETPLGRVPVARDLVAGLKERLDLVEVPRESEHSIEIQLPFLQTVLPSFSLLPVMAGTADLRGCRDLSDALTEILAQRDALVVASTDLHHSNSRSAVERGDKAVAEAIASFDAVTVRRALEPETVTVCGKVPIAAAMETCRARGADRVEILRRTHSQDEYEGPYSGTYTVGYLAAGFWGR
jgi:hypothetical protein